MIRCPPEADHRRPHRGRKIGRGLRNGRKPCTLSSPAGQIAKSRRCGCVRFSSSARTSVECEHHRHAMSASRNRPSPRCRLPPKPPQTHDASRTKQRIKPRSRLMSVGRWTSISTANESPRQTPLPPLGAGSAQSIQFTSRGSSGVGGSELLRPLQGSSNQPSTPSAPWPSIVQTTTRSLAKL